MTADQVALLVVWLGASLAVVAVVAWAVPLIARIRFLTEIDTLRDEAVDLQLAGRLSDDPAIGEFLAIQEYLRKHSREFSLVRLIGMDVALEKLGVEPHPRRSYNNLPADQRSILHALEHRSVQALARYLIWGSPFGYLGAAVYRCLAPSLRWISRQVKRVPSAEQLAEEAYEQTREDVEVRRVAKARGSRRPNGGQYPPVQVAH